MPGPIMSNKPYESVNEQTSCFCSTVGNARMERRRKQPRAADLVPPCDVEVICEQDGYAGRVFFGRLLQVCHGYGQVEFPYAVSEDNPTLLREWVPMPNMGQDEAALLQQGVHPGSIRGYEDPELDLQLPPWERSMVLRPRYSARAPVPDQEWQQLPVNALVEVQLRKETNELVLGYVDLVDGELGVQRDWPVDGEDVFLQFDKLEQVFGGQPRWDSSTGDWEEEWAVVAEVQAGEVLQQGVQLPSYVKKGEELFVQPDTSLQQYRRALLRYVPKDMSVLDICIFQGAADGLHDRVEIIDATSSRIWRGGKKGLQESQPGIWQPVPGEARQQQQELGGKVDTEVGADEESGVQQELEQDDEPQERRDQEGREQQKPEPSKACHEGDKQAGEEDWGGTEARGCGRRKEEEEEEQQQQRRQPLAGARHQQQAAKRQLAARFKTAACGGASSSRRGPGRARKIICPQRFRSAATAAGTAAAAAPTRAGARGPQQGQRKAKNRTLNSRHTVQESGRCQKQQRHMCTPGASHSGSGGVYNPAAHAGAASFAPDCLSMVLIAPFLTPPAPAVVAAGGGSSSAAAAGSGSIREAGGVLPFPPLLGSHSAAVGGGSEAEPWPGQQQQPAAAAAADGVGHPAAVGDAIAQDAASGAAADLGVGGTSSAGLAQLLPAQHQGGRAKDEEEQQQQQQQQHMGEALEPQPSGATNHGGGALQQQVDQQGPDPLVLPPCSDFTAQHKHLVAWLEAAQTRGQLLPEQAQEVRLLLLEVDGDQAAMASFQARTYPLLAGAASSGPLGAQLLLELVQTARAKLRKR